MNKQQVIRKAYGERYEDLQDFINQHGVFVGDTDNITDQEFKDCDFVASTTPLNEGKLVSSSRPKSLQGIEHNNGWIKIESESDLPKYEIIQCHLIIKNGDMELYGGFRRYTSDTYYFFNSKGDGYLIDAVTHYQPITKPLKPIY